MLTVCGLVTGEVEGKEQIRPNAKKQKGSSCDDGNGRKGPLVPDIQPLVLNFDMRPIFIGQETTNVTRLQHNPRTVKNTGNDSR